MTRILQLALATFSCLGLVGACSDPLTERQLSTRESPLVSPPEERAAVDGFFTAPASSTFVLKPGNIASVNWRYTTNTPSSRWNTTSYTPIGWSTGSPGFYYGGFASPEDVGRTAWSATKAKLWLRTSFSATSSDLAKLMFWGRWDDTIEIYINGVLAAKEGSWSSGYRYLGFTTAGRAALKSGTNTIAVLVQDTGGGKYFDLGVTRNATLAASRPMSGTERTEALAAFGNTVRDFMIRHGITAGVVSVMKNDQVVVNRAIGWTGKDFATAIAPNTVMRLASNDKIVTKAAVRRLIDSGVVDPVTQQTITESTLVFPLLAAHGITSAPGMTPDPRINQITVQHLLEHNSGVADIPEPADDSNFYSLLGITPDTSTMADDVRWVCGSPLKYPPGEVPFDERYSSTGYMVLRYLVHAVSGDLIGYLRNTLLAPVGTSDIFIAAERLQDRSPREPGYATLQEPYDRWVNLENFSGLSATSEAMVRFLRGYDLITGAQLIDPNTGVWSPDLCVSSPGIFFGSMAGTWSVTEQLCNQQVSFAVIFNINGLYDSEHDDLRASLEQIVYSLSPSDWGL